MYWYNSSPCHCEEQQALRAGATKQAHRHNGFGHCLVIALVSILFISSCKPDIKETGATRTYFDLKGYFKVTASNLGAHNKPVFKTVVHNNSTESKKVTIANWEQELSLFTLSDINKPAWKDSYEVLNTPNAIFYRTKDDNLDTKEITINHTGDKVKWIIIINHTKNLLYETKEKLTFIPDSMYRIEKTQQVRLLGMNRYDIKGMLNQ